MSGSLPADGGMNSPVVNIGSLMTGGIPVSMTGSQRREVRGDGLYETVWPSFGSLQLVKKTTRPSALIPLTVFQLDDELVRAVKLTSRERRFIKFASVEYDGQLYMTPQDFLESVVEQEPRREYGVSPRLKRRVLTSKELEMIRDQTPPLSQSSPQMFRTLRDKGIISYTEYLFLLSILTKPRTGFEIAFNMFDTDGNQRVDKNEFLVKCAAAEIFVHRDDQINEHNEVHMVFDIIVNRVSIQNVTACLQDLQNYKVLTHDDCLMPRRFNQGRGITPRSLLDPSPHLLGAAMRYITNKKNNFALTDQNSFDGRSPTMHLHQKPKSKMEKIFSHAWRGKHGIPDTGSTEDKTPVEAATPYEEYVDDSQGLQRRHLVDTTLIVHFFGKKGKDELQYEGFRKFMENLQTEVLELEFHEFSKGQDTISEVDFAKILLRYTYLDTNEYDMYLDRLLDRIKEEKGITFNEFQVFCQFLNNLEDFTIAMRMYTLADHPISKDEFLRAVKICTGTNLSRHLVHIVFQIFDEDGDGNNEFSSRGSHYLWQRCKSYAKNEGWEAFKSCVKQEMKSPI
uniref:EF-hand domain-containing protein n=1 Tax=Timema poppense TaxID=170557 RepID=A0A7R9D0V3_TIMPO|nr:unnamed protein product [Timema poppensis]